MSPEPTSNEAITNMDTEKVLIPFLIETAPDFLEEVREALEEALEPEVDPEPEPELMTGVPEAMTPETVPLPEAPAEERTPAQVEAVVADFKVAEPLKLQALEFLF